MIDNRRALGSVTRKTHSTLSLSLSLGGSRRRRKTSLSISLLESKDCVYLFDPDSGRLSSTETDINLGGSPPIERNPMDHNALDLCSVSEASMMKTINQVHRTMQYRCKREGVE
ncbi:uncharacterized protein LOC108851430 [Raphanus sativus]|uniref:Uncharacterized protein LOC108851430 n=1 Tax=Raphanus sativus TaxID=3726 RepID=A0A9W3DKD0_RAPSA|nr:uncharacterized protein LOC108851430 [Raphanus sativus]